MNKKIAPRPNSARGGGIMVCSPFRDEAQAVDPHFADARGARVLRLFARNVARVVDDVIFAPFADDAVVPRSLFFRILCEQGRVRLVGRVFAEGNFAQIVLRALRAGIPDKILFVLIAVARIHEEMPVPLAEIKRAHDGVPVLPRTEAVFHENLFVDRGHDDGHGFPFGGEHVRQPVHGDVSSRPFRFIIVEGIENIILPAALYDVRIDGKSGDDRFFVFERPFGRTRHGNFDRLFVMVGLPLGDRRIVHIIRPVPLDDAGRPIKVYPFFGDGPADIFPPLGQFFGHVRFYTAVARSVNIIFPSRFENVGIGLGRRPARFR